MLKNTYLKSEKMSEEVQYRMEETDYPLPDADGVIFTAPLAEAVAALLIAGIRGGFRRGFQFGIAGNRVLPCCAENCT